ncbi:thioesterase II family protein [Streptomyces sp. NPDC055607]
MTNAGRNAGAWLLCRRRNPGARVRVYCFPHGGGSPGEYLRWADDLPDAEVWGVQLPGRGGRLMETAVPDMNRLVDMITEAVDFTGPFVFFGHSLGTLVAFETARRLVAEGREAPGRLLLSAMWAPHLDLPRPDVARMDDEELLARVDDAHGTLPEAVRRDPDLVSLMAPAYRADFTMLDAYRYEPGEPLDIPMTLFGGAQDSASERLADWRDHTRHEIRTHLFPGGHFYFRDNRHDFVAALRRAVLG